MLIHRYKSYILVMLAGLVVSACAGLQPSHYGKFLFQGVVKDEQGKPVPQAWVKVRGWETMTDAQGRWKQEQILHCGALRDKMSDFEENDSLLVTATGYEPAEEDFIVKHAGWFQSCEPPKAIVIETVLKRESTERKENREADEFKPRQEKEIPWPEESKKRPKLKRGETHL